MKDNRKMKLKPTDWTFRGDTIYFNTTPKLGNGSHYVIRDGKAYPLCCYAGEPNLNVTITPLPFRNYEVVND